ncbi:hypothetical protein Mapa_012005 [Marchantia paleacea]|nr:hypothetical protein Mapa_012005 [Marchantia paleacea]
MCKGTHVLRHVQMRLPVSCRVIDEHVKSGVHRMWNLHLLQQHVLLQLIHILHSLLPNIFARWSSAIQLETNRILANVVVSRWNGCRIIAGIAGLGRLMGRQGLIVYPQIVRFTHVRELVPKLGAVKAVPHLDDHHVLIFIEECELRVEEISGGIVHSLPVPGFSDLVGDGFPHVPQAIDVGVMTVEDGIPSGVDEIAHVLVVGVVRVIDQPCPLVSDVVGIFHPTRLPGNFTRAGVDTCSRIISPNDVRSTEKISSADFRGHLVVHDTQVLVSDLLVGQILFALCFELGVVSQMQDLGRHVVGVSELIEEGSVGYAEVGKEHGGDHSCVLVQLVVPVPEGKGESGIIDQTGENSLVVVQIDPMPRKKRPAVVNLEQNAGLWAERAWSLSLLEGLVTEGAVDPPLVQETSGIGVWEGLHSSVS